MLVRVLGNAGYDALLLVRHASCTVPSGSGRQAGTGGHNSDEALVASRFLSSHDPPARPPQRATKGRPSRSTRPHSDTHRSVSKQVRSRRTPRRDLHCFKTPVPPANRDFSQHELSFDPVNAKPGSGANQTTLSL